MSKKVRYFLIFLIVAPIFLYLNWNLWLRDYKKAYLSEKFQKLVLNSSVLKNFTFVNPQINYDAALGLGEILDNGSKAPLQGDASSNVESTDKEKVFRYLGVKISSNDVFFDTENFTSLTVQNFDLNFKDLDDPRLLELNSKLVPSLSGTKELFIKNLTLGVDSMAPYVNSPLKITSLNIETYPSNDSNFEYLINNSRVDAKVLLGQFDFRIKLTQVEYAGRREPKLSLVGLDFIAMRNLLEEKNELRILDGKLNISFTFRRDKGIFVEVGVEDMRVDPDPTIQSKEFLSYPIWKIEKFADDNDGHFSFAFYSKDLLEINLQNYSKVISKVWGELWANLIEKVKRDIVAIASQVEQQKLKRMIEREIKAKQEGDVE